MDPIFTPRGIARVIQDVRKLPEGSSFLILFPLIFGRTSVSDKQSIRVRLKVNDYVVEIK